MYLVDTNVIIYYLNGDVPAVDFMQNNRKKLAISCITWIEVMSYPFSDEEERVVRSFLQKLKLIEISEPVMEQSAALRRQKKIKLPDAMIAATALSQGFTLVTRNTADFKSVIPRLLNPFAAEQGTL